MQALEKTQKRLIIVCPWLSKYGIEDEVIGKFKALLESRNSCIDIGWGYRKDWENGTVGDWSNSINGWKYSALPELIKLEERYPGRFRLKALGTHEKFLVCDSNFAMLGSHNFLTSSSKSNEREIGLRTTESRIIQDMITRFDNASALKVQIAKF
jgi:hypothetical protein